MSFEVRGISPGSCAHFEFIARGPLFPEQADMAAHKMVRDEIAALEKALAVGLAVAGPCNQYRLFEGGARRGPMGADSRGVCRRLSQAPRLKVRLRK